MSDASQQMLTLAQLRERGWSPALVRDFLGGADTTACNPRYRSAAPVRLYAIARIESAERSAEFAQAQAVSSRRSAAAKQAADAKHALLLQQVAAMKIQVAERDLADVRRQAIEHYNGRGRGGGSASPQSPALFLDRITVNYVRHELTAYDRALAAVVGHVGAPDAVQAVRRKIFRAIATAYPALEAECEEQAARRGLGGI